MQAASIVFETDRLILRHIWHQDVHAMHSVYGDRDAMRWVGDGTPLDLAGCRQWIDITQQNYRSRGYGMYAVVLKGMGAIIGFCGLVHPNNQPEVEIKYALHRDYWGKSYATEVVSALLRHAASDLGIPQVIATVAPENVASSRVLIKSSMHLARMRRNEDGSETLLFSWMTRTGTEK